VCFYHIITTIIPLSLFKNSLMMFVYSLLHMLCSSFTQSFSHNGPLVIKYQCVCVCYTKVVKNLQAVLRLAIQRFWQILWQQITDDSLSKIAFFKEFRGRAHNALFHSTFQLNKLECLSLASLPNLVNCLRVRPGACHKMEHPKALL